MRTASRPGGVRIALYEPLLKLTALSIIRTRKVAIGLGVLEVL